MNCVSIIVPVYNVYSQLEKCVMSITQQTYTNLEILLVDDGSNDGSSKLCDILSQRDTRIKVFHKENGGLSSARNLGIKQAHGNYYLFIDSDDYISPMMVEILLRNIKLENADMAICGYIDIFSNSKKSHSFVRKNNFTYDTFWSSFFNSNEPLLYTIPWNKLYKSKLFNNTRYLEGRINEDEYIIENIVAQCKKITTVTECLYFYVHRENSITSNSKLSERSCDGIDALEERTVSFLKKNKIAYAQQTLTIIPYLLCQLKGKIDSGNYDNKLALSYKKIRGKYFRIALDALKRKFNGHLIIQMILLSISPKLYILLTNSKNKNENS